MININEITGQELVDHLSEKREPQAEKKKPWIRRDFPFIIIGIIVLFVAFSFAKSEAQATPDADFKDAQIAYSKALAGHCSIIGAKTNDCYTGGDCESLQESINWFMGDDGYGEAPEVACKNLTGNLK